MDPTTDVSELFTILYPYSTILNKDGCAAVTNVLKSFRLKPSDNPSYLKIVEKKPIDEENCVVYTNNNVALEVNEASN